MTSEGRDGGGGRGGEKARVGVGLGRLGERLPLSLSSSYPPCRMPVTKTSFRVYSVLGKGGFGLVRG